MMEAFRSGAGFGWRKSAREAGVSGRVSFEVAAAKQYAGRDYDFVTVFDCLHDMGDPRGLPPRAAVPQAGWHLDGDNLAAQAVADYME